MTHIDQQTELIENWENKKGKKVIIQDGNLCEDNGQPLSCPLQPVMAMVQQGIKPKTVYIRQGCVINCTHFKQDGDTVKLLCCKRKFKGVITKPATGGN